MIKKNKKFPNAIPLESTFLDKNFLRHYLIFSKESSRDDKLFRIITEELVRKAKDGVLYGETQVNRRIGKTKLSDSQKKQIIREYEAAVVKYGTIKSLARKFDVSDDTIRRIVNQKPTPKETKQD